MDRVPAARWRAVGAALERWGLLLAQDGKLPSVTTLAAGEVVRGSWWSHRENGAIYDAFGRLEREGAFSARLVDGKWAYVHERLVPAVHAVATSGAAWQTDGLSSAAVRLLARLRRGDEVRTDDATDVAARRLVAAAANELETRLLAESRQVHTESGHHTRVVTAWRAPPGLPLPAAEAARATLAAAVDALNAAHGARARLPWQSRRSRTPRVVRS